MREILFRGKRMDNGKWAEGYLYEHEPALVGIASENDVPEPSKWFIARTGFADWNMPRPVEFVEVEPSAGGQYTGLKDRNGKRVFEGDIVTQNWYDHDEPSDDSFGEVVFCEYDCSFSVMDVNKDGFMPLGRCGSYHWEVEVIGNIHDNPDMLKGGEGL